MRAVVQRVTYSSVEVDGVIVGEINKGFNVLLGISKEDTEEDMKYIKDKLINLRVFEDAITFKIALMVVQYMKYMETLDY